MFHLNSFLRLKAFSIPIVLVLLISQVKLGSAQEATPANPTYIVQPGDSLWAIAARFGVTVDELSQANGIQNPNQLTLGVELIIPGLEGVSGILTTRPIQFGESLRSLSRRYRLPLRDLARMNRLVSPANLYVGANLILTEEINRQEQVKRVTLSTAEATLELAVSQAVNPWSLVLNNQLEHTWQIIAGDVLLVESNETLSQQESSPLSPDALPELITTTEIKPLPLVQGKATVIKIVSPAPLNLQGSLGDYPLTFFQADHEYVAIQGIHSMLEPGFYPLTLRGTLENNTPFSFSQPVYIKDGGYLFETVQINDKTLLDPEISQPEEEQLRSLVTANTPQKMWQGMFTSPVDQAFTECWPSTFGRRRSYNGSTFSYIHSGLDFCGQTGNNIYAPADGKVIAVLSLSVRGLTTIIDHGWGIYSVYSHQSEALVKEGDIVTPGQVIGLVGASGRVTGPHLHWEIWAGGVQVDPWDWLQNQYP